MTFATVVATCGLWVVLRLATADDGYALFALDLAHIQPFRMFSYALVHTGVGHLLLNMLVVALFGAYVERRTGALPWISVYVLGAFAASASQVAVTMIQAQQLGGKMVGASGAGAAIVGWALMLSVREPAKGWTWVVRVAAPTWVAIQIYEGVTASPARPDGGVSAIWAHLGGFLFGALLCALWPRDKTGDLDAAEALLKGGNPVAALAKLEGPSPDEARRLTLLARAAREANDKEQEREALLSLAERGASEPILRRLTQLQSLGSIPAALRLDLVQTVPEDLRQELLASFLADPISEPLRPNALLRLADLLAVSNPQTAQKTLERVIADYPNTDAADLARARRR